MFISTSTLLSKENSKATIPPARPVDIDVDFKMSYFDNGQLYN